MLYSKAPLTCCTEITVRASDGQFIHWDQNFQVLTGFVPESSFCFYEQIALKDREKIRQIFLECTKYQTISLQWTGPDGTVSDYAMNLSPGKIPGTVHGFLFAVSDMNQLRQEWLHANQWLSALLSNLQGGLFHCLVKPNHGILVDFISEGMLAILDCTEEQFEQRYGRDISLMIAEEDRRKLFSPDESDSNRTSHFEIRMITYTGEIRWLAVNRQIVHLSMDSFEAYIVVNDITEAYRAKQQFEDIANSVPGGVARIRLDPQLHVLYMTEGFCQLSQRTCSEFLKDTNGEVTQVIYPDDLPGVYKQVEEQRKNAMITLNLRIFRKDGSIVWIHCVARKISETDDIFQGVFTDITDNVLAQQEREHLLWERNELINAIPGGLVQFSLVGQEPKILFASAGFYQLFGYSQEEYYALYGKGFLKAVYPSEQSSLQETLEQHFFKTGQLATQIRIVHKDGHIRWLSISGNRAVEPDGKEIYRCIFTDITGSKQIQQELEYEKERYRLMLECMENVTYEYDLESDQMTFYYRSPATGNQVATTCQPYSKELVRRNFVAPEYQALIIHMIRGEYPGDPKEILAHRPQSLPDSPYTWHEIRNVAIRGEDGKVIRSIGVLRDIDDEKRENLRLRYRSERDSLTGLYNKAACFANVSDYLEREGADRISAVLMIDFDNFKTVNDTYGHQYGDAVLANIGKGMRKLFRESDIVARIGGDEFLVFMKDLVDDAIVKEKADALCRLFRNMYQNTRTPISGSVGIAVAPRDGRSCEELIRKADIALYSIKKDGKDSYRFYTLKEDLAAQLKGPSYQHSLLPAIRTDRNRPHIPDEFSLIKAVILVLNQKETEPIRHRIFTVLELVGRHCEADRMFFLDHGNPQLNVLPWKVEWHINGINSEADFLDSSDETEYIQHLDIQGIFSFSLNEENETVNPSLTARMKARGSLATLQMPIRQNGLLRAIVGMDDCNSARSWTKRQAEILSTITNLLSAYLPISEEEN